MVQIIIIKKDSELIYENFAIFSDIYKKCGFRKDDGFEKIADFSDDSNEVNIELWGKLSGKCAVKNTYVFPINSIAKKIYGNCVLLRKSCDKYVDLEQEVWDTVKVLFKAQPSNEIHNQTKMKIIKQQIDTIKDSISQVSNEITNTINASNASNASNPFAVTIKCKDEQKEELLEISDTDSDLSEESNDSELKEETYVYSDEEAV